MLLFQKIYRERELNPHLKNEGTGLPEVETKVEALSLPSTSVGDGGYSWLKKAYYRIQEQAQSEGRSMEEVAVERWGVIMALSIYVLKNSCHKLFILFFKENIYFYSLKKINAHKNKMNKIPFLTQITLNEHLIN